jgi:Fe-S cluster assembly ATP-binding protein
MFEIKNLHVSVDGKEIIKGLSLRAAPGEIHAIMGPNGAGKSSLAQALMGHPSFKVKGSIRLGEEELNGMSADKRAKKGLFLAFQNPEEIEGVKVSNFIRRVLAARGGSAKDLDSMVRAHEELVKTTEAMGMDKSFVSRELNVGFSGGEKKRLELLQMLVLKPKVVVLDEVDSGLDVDGIRLVAQAIKKLDDGKRCFLIITHYPRVLKYVKPDFVHILVHGKLVESGGARLAHEVEEHGYSGYLKEVKAETAAKSAKPAR